MLKKTYIFLALLLVSILIPIVVVASTFNSQQLANTPSNGLVLQTNGFNNSWVSTTTLGVGSGTVNSGTFGQVTYYGANGTAVSGTSTLVVGTTTTDANNVGIGTTNPTYGLTVRGGPTLQTALFQGADSSHETQVVIKATTATTGGVGNAPFIIQDLSGNPQAYIRQDGGLYAQFFSGFDNATVALVAASGNPGGNVNGVDLSSAASIGWANIAAWYITPDLTMSRLSAGVLGIGQNTLTGNSSNGTLVAGNIGVGTNTPFANLSVQANPATTSPIFEVATSSGKDTFDIMGNGHVRTTGSRPLVSSCGTSPTIFGNDTNFHLYVGSTLATSCTVGFASNFKFAPICTMNQEGGSAIGLDASTTPSTLVITGGTFTSDRFAVHCEEPNEDH